MTKLSLPFLFILNLAFLFLGCVSSSQFHKTEIPPDQQLTEQLTTILDHPDLAPMTIGIKIMSPITGETIFARHSDRLFHPGSNMKMFTATGVLRTMGPDYRYITSVFTEKNASVNKDTLFTSLFLVGRGDPLLESKHLTNLANTVAKKTTAKVIKGNVIIDQSYLDLTPFGEGWMWDDIQYRFSAPINALSINGNSIRILISPGASIGSPVSVRVDPPNASINFDVRAKTTKESSPNRFTTPPIRVERDWQSRTNKIQITGTLGINDQKQEFYRSIEEPGVFAGSLFRDQLHRLGVKITGNIYYGHTPPLAQPLAHHISTPISKALSHLLKDSDNLTAELLLKTMGRYKTSNPGNSLDGLKVLRKELEDYIGLIPDSYRFSDGSGLSWYNYLSPDQITNLLLKNYHDSSTGNIFRESLAVAGVDGTLKHRMRNTLAMGNLRAKTGTLTGVSCLSGYVWTKNNKPLIFSIMINNFVGSSMRARRVQDEIGVVLANCRLN